MANLQIKNFVNDIYQTCGNLNRDQLPLETVLQFLYNELNKRLKQGNVSEQNLFLKSAERSVTSERDQLVSVDDWGTPVSVHFIDGSNGREIPVEMVNFNTLIDWEREGDLKCSIYGTPPRIRFSTAINSFSNWRLKYWYEPNTEIQKGTAADVVVVSPQFRPLVTMSVAKMCLPFAELNENTKMELRKNIVEELVVWEELWTADCDTSKQYGNNIRRPWRAGQPRGTARSGR